MLTRPTDIADADVAGFVTDRWELDVTTLDDRPWGRRGTQHGSIETERGPGSLERSTAECAAI